jgi:hypothetical protein
MQYNSIKSFVKDKSFEYIIYNNSRNSNLSNYYEEIKKMAAIPSLVWLLIGAIVVGVSWYIEMPLFFWIGWAFIALGIAKLAIGFILGKKETKQERKTASPAAQKHLQQHYRCSCGNPVKITDNFCNYCGRRLR